MPSGGRSHHQSRFEAYSAGTQPRSDPSSFALDVLQQRGRDISVLRAEIIAEFRAEDAPKFDFVFTVCNQAANGECPG